MDLEDIENKIARLGAENALLKDKLGEAAHVNIALAEDALAKLAATTALLNHIEECEKCDLKYDLLVLLEDSVHQFMMAGLEPNNDPTTQANAVLGKQSKKQIRRLHDRP